LFAPGEKKRGGGKKPTKRKEKKLFRLIGFSLRTKKNALSKCGL